MNPEIPQDVPLQEALDSIGVRPLNPSEIHWVSQRFKYELFAGIHMSRPRSLASIDTLLPPVRPESLQAAAGKEALVIEIGGTNLYAARVQLDERGTPHILQRDENDYAQGVWSKTKFDSPDEYFEEIHRHLSRVITNGPIDHIAIVYSYPGEAKRTSRGVDVMSEDITTKGFEIKDMHLNPVGESFVRYEKSQGVEISDDTRLVVLNDTPATLYAIPESKIGMVDATGYNLAVRLNGVTYNLEAGGFEYVPRGWSARMCDSQIDPSKSDKKQLAEKQISGLYMGMQLGNIINGFSDRLGVRRLRPKELLPGKIVRDILTADREALRQYFAGEIRGRTLFDLQRIAQNLSDRSAQLVGIQIGVVVRENPEEFPVEEVPVSVDGSFFWNVPFYPARVKEMADMISGKQFVFPRNHRPGILGAAVAVLVS